MNNKPSSVGKQNSSVGLVNLNGNLLCAIDTETTGVEDGPSDLNVIEIVELAVIPLDHNLEIHKGFPPFITKLKPELLGPNDVRPPGMSEKKFMDYMMYGHSQYTASELFTEWFNKLNLGTNKKITPLAHNWPFDHKMLHSWLGPKNYNFIFHGFYRCTMGLANMLNDSAELKLHDEVPYPKKGLGTLCSKYGVELVNAHTASDDAMATAKVYKEMLKSIRA